MVDKVKAAVSARRDPDFVIVARSDARSLLGLDATIQRINAYADAGADAVFIYGAESEDEWRQIGKAARAPLVGHLTHRGRVRGMTAAKFEEMGFRMVIFPFQAILAAVAAMNQVLSAILRDPTDVVSEELIARPEELHR